ncbi:helix-turn-helix domain-containing protein [Sporolactobacillus nakayamae]|uniref:Transcriptional regulator, contains XRE-family HTH domain n=1 Tax=Sporolactobacillus nakayamae TaxID=269670 RepID=A0A1I2UAK7_9BACL|nr:helix-turn-helix transcriptional regulator [Sporolactobacillus nakayamae]SFG71681.1 Transcriptional regulator, contains XRE-family HTH domain [Sporolactobacillus nakayamae]
MSFQDKLLNLRKQKGWSQEKLAENLGVSRQAVSKWESGQSLPDMDKLISLSDLFEVSIDSMVKDHTVREKHSVHARQLTYPYLLRRQYEYKSKRTLFGLPLVHINFNFDGISVAKGILAIGNISIGFLSLGGLAIGGLCFGGVSLGIIGFGGAVLGLLAAAGGLAIGSLAIGGLAIGLATLGGLSIGMFSIGGAAIASHVAIGDYANGHIAIGHTARGLEMIVTHANFNDISAKQVRMLIHKEYPHMWKPIIDFLTFFFR